MGPVIDGDTIPTKGSSPQGVSARRLHIAVRRHYKETGLESDNYTIMKHGIFPDFYVGPSRFFVLP